MLFFEGTYLSSMGIAGAIVVGSAVFYGLTFLPALLADAERQVTESTLLNPRLREEDLVAALRRGDTRTVLVESTVSSPRWAGNYAVRLALVLQPKTPLPLALQQISSLVPRDLRRVAQQSDLPRLVRLAAEGVLEAPE